MKSEKQLIVSNNKANIFLKKLLLTKDPDIGYDVETTGLSPFDNHIVGFSLYSKELQVAAYFPVAHEEEDSSLASYNLSWDKISYALQELFIHKNIIMHGASFDMFMTRMVHKQNPFKFYKTTCTLQKARRLSPSSAALKNLVLEFGLVQPGESISFKKIIQSVFNLPEVSFKNKKSTDQILSEYHFGKIDVMHHPEAIQYACNDSIWAVNLNPILDKTIQSRQRIIHQTLLELPAYQKTLCDKGFSNINESPFLKAESPFVKKTTSKKTTSKKTTSKKTTSYVTPQNITKMILTFPNGDVVEIPGQPSEQTQSSSELNPFI